MSDRVVVMNAGVIEQQGPPREIYERPATRFVAGFVGVTNVVDRDGCTVSIRPEKVRFVPASEGAAVAGVVEDARYLGDITHWRVRLDDGSTWTVFARAESDDLALGSRVGLAWNPDHAVRLER